MCQPYFCFPFWYTPSRDILRKMHTCVSLLPKGHRSTTCCRSRPFRVCASKAPVAVRGKRWKPFNAQEACFPLPYVASPAIHAPTFAYQCLAVQEHPYALSSHRPHFRHAQEARSSAVLSIGSERRCRMVAFSCSQPKGPQDAGSSTAALRAGSRNASHTRECRTTVHTFLHRSWGKLPIETCITPLSIKA